MQRRLSLAATLARFNSFGPDKIEVFSWSRIVISKGVAEKVKE